MRSLVVVSALLLAGCSVGGGGEADSAVESAPGDDGSGGVSEEAASGEDRAPLAAPAADEDQQFITEGSVSLLVDDPAEAAQSAAQLVEAAGGHVQERVEQGGGDDDAASAYLVVRVPTSEVTGTLAALKELGTIENSSLTSTEVTAQVRDLDARIRALQISVARLEDLLGRAGTITEVVEAEQILTQRQSELESLQSQAAGLADQVAMATFRLDLYSEGAAPEEPPTGFWAGLVSGWDALVATLTTLLQILGAILPWLLFAGIITAGVIAAARWNRRRRPAMAPASAPHPSGPTTAMPRHPSRQPQAEQGWPTGPPPVAPAQQTPQTPQAPQTPPAPPAPVATEAPGADAQATAEMPTPSPAHVTDPPRSRRVAKALDNDSPEA